MDLNKPTTITASLVRIDSNVTENGVASGSVVDSFASGFKQILNNILNNSSKINIAVVRGGTVEEKLREHVMAVSINMDTKLSFYHGNNCLVETINFLST